MADLVQASGQQVVGIFPLWAQTEAQTSGLRPSLSWWSVSVSVRVNAPDVHDAHEWNIQPAFCMYVCYRINWCVSSGL